ncbi:hypothetical protein HWV07_04265 [Natronomonas salina]|nr:hypothetical protein [Natronomonas salina]QLD88288.1 hypothetical protein HWV07_04265 [Natronomonas salina]
MPKVTMSGEGDTIIEAIYDLSLNVEAALKRAKAASDETPDATGDRP